MNGRALYLGLDSSTQGLKAILIDAAQGLIVAQSAVNYGRDLPSYGCPDGVLPSSDPLVRHSDPMLWLAGLDLLFERMRREGLPLHEVAAIGGSGQQHGSVYLNGEFFKIVAELQTKRDLAVQFAPALARRTSPIWMDSSTSAECAEISRSAGANLHSITGSHATERFTGPQIRKFFKTDPKGYRDTQRIHLVSSFLCSVLCGSDVPVDSGDAAGMNLLNLKNLEWDASIAEATAPDLLSKLPRIAAWPGSRAEAASTIEGAAHSCFAGGLSPYFAKYGLIPGIPVAVWTGDNPASLIGSGAFQSDTAVISLGTSDTFFAVLRPFRVDPAGFGHVFGHVGGGFMSLTCFKNGSLARDRIRTDAGVDWNFFDKDAFEETPPGNSGRWALPWLEAEITPLVTKPGLRANFDFNAARPETRIRAVVEAQAMSMRAHSQWMGEFKLLRVTGGASKSAGIVQTFADVFGSQVETISTTNSAALGAAMIAANIAGVHGFQSLATAFCPATKQVAPREEAVAVYHESLGAFQRFESEAASR